MDAHHLDLEGHAAISAELAEGVRDQGEVLRAHGLNEQQWAEATRHWMSLIAEDALARGSEATLAIRYSDAFAEVQDAQKAPPQMSPEAYAELVVDIQRWGGTKHALAERGLTLPDYIRASRYFAGLFVRDPIAHKQYFERFLSLQPKPEA